jgi:glycosyltransferase involved in cell wall biosynthesis
MYLGSHGRANALESVLEAFNEACTTAGDADLRLRLVGEGPLKDDLKAQADAYPSADRITFEDKIPEDEVISRAHEADCLVANMHDLPVYRFGVGLNKSYMYLAAGRPVVLGSSAPNCPITEAGAGLVVPGDDSKAMSVAMLAVARLPFAERAKMALAGRQLLVEHYTYDTLAEKLAHGLDCVAVGNPTRLPKGAL